MCCGTQINLFPFTATTVSCRSHRASFSPPPSDPPFRHFVITFALCACNLAQTCPPILFETLLFFQSIFALFLGYCRVRALASFLPTREIPSTQHLHTFTSVFYLPLFITVFVSSFFSFFRFTETTTNLLITFRRPRSPSVLETRNCMSLPAVCAF